MASQREITFSDIERAVQSREPLLADLVVRYLEQPDPPENRPEEPPPGADQASDEAPPLAADAWTVQRMRDTVSPAKLAYKTASERKAIRAEAWEGIASASHPPPRLKLADLLVDLYRTGDEPERAALMEIFTRAKLGWGIWGAFKRVYKLAERRHDAAMFGVLAWRLDAYIDTPINRQELSKGTFIYLRRRAWRYLRQLGLALPELYPQFAVQVLRHYPQSFRFYTSWVANQIWAHDQLKGQLNAWMSGPPQKLEKRAFHHAWKLSPDPLLRLLEDAQNDAVCQFAIRSLKEDFPETLREVSVEWLARIGNKPLASVHEFIVDLLTDSPEFHQSKLKKLGLHDMVLGLLFSTSDRACKYAVSYARAHGGQLAVDLLVRLADDGSGAARTFAGEQLSQMTAKKVGLDALVRLLGISATSKMAAKKIRAGFSPADITAEQYIVMATGSSAQSRFVAAFFKEKKKKIPAGYLCALLDDDRCSYWEGRTAIGELGKRSGNEVGIEWVKKALLASDHSWEVMRWLRGGMFKGPDLDVAWIKGLVMRPNLRSDALAILGNRKLVAPSSIGLSWLLAMARQPDEALNQFAHRYLLEHFTPKDIAAEMGSKDVSVGIDKLWSMAAGADEPEPVRRFAGTYLRMHHPELSPTMAEARSLGIKPRLGHNAYGLDRVRPLFFDARPDVRALARAVGRRELLRWKDGGLLFDLAASRYKEPRSLAGEMLFSMGQDDADGRVVPPLSWLSASRVFSLAEGPVKGTREIALTLIRRHYGRLGGAERMAWLMESPDREVRLFAVRLLWEKHRPRQTPDHWKPKSRRADDDQAVADDLAPFESTGALRHFLRTVMFGLPPGRMERRDAGAGAMPDRPLPASVAKRRLVEVVRDMALEDADFAALAVPVLEEFSASRAKGEWQGCVAALARIRTVHPGLVTALPASSDTASTTEENLTA